jgi:ATP sulfurylase
VSLFAAAEELEELRERGSNLPSLRISERSACDRELLACGAFSPLDHFVTKEEQQSILEQLRLPVRTRVSDSFAREFRSGLASGPGNCPAQCQTEFGILTVEQIYE